ncbi:transcriptional regulator [Cellulosimicrobium funkei]|nr:transcriptional regulator [Cellulosimicrobium funkei]
MTERPSEAGTTWPSSPDLVVLHAVRLGGFADTPAVADRTDLGINAVEASLLDLAHQGLIERMSFGGDGGWILSEEGQERLTALLAEERQASNAHAALASTADRFEELNTRLVRVLTAWQLHSPAERAKHRDSVLGELADLADALDHLLTDLAAHLPRFARYPRQFTAAMRAARAGEDRWVAGVGLLSCHTVWAELHQDLLSSLGRARTAEPGPSGR